VICPKESLPSGKRQVGKDRTACHAMTLIKGRERTAEVMFIGLRAVEPIDLKHHGSRRPQFSRASATRPGIEPTRVPLLRNVFVFQPASAGD